MKSSSNDIPPIGTRSEALLYSQGIGRVHSGICSNASAAGQCTHKLCTSKQRHSTAPISAQGVLLCAVSAMQSTSNPRHKGPPSFPANRPTPLQRTIGVLSKHVQFRACYAENVIYQAWVVEHSTSHPTHIIRCLLLLPPLLLRQPFLPLCQLLSVRTRHELVFPAVLCILLGSLLRQQPLVDDLLLLLALLSGLEQVGDIAGLWGEVGEEGREWVKGKGGGAG